MSYIKKNLMPGEKLLYREKLHWALFMGPAFLLVFGIILNELNYILGYIVIFLSGLYFLISLINRIISEIGITNKRLIIKTGIIKRKLISVDLGKIKSLTWGIGPLGAGLKYGTMVINPFKGETQYIHKVPNPWQFINQYQQLSRKAD